MKKSLIEIIAKIRNDEPLTSEEKTEFIRHAMCTNHSGKMYGMNSISTSALNNPFCMARRLNPKLICHECYSCSQMKRQPNTANKYELAYEFYNNYHLDPLDIPYLGLNVCRIEAFGDVGSVLHELNYIEIARNNPNCYFVQWTKNLPILAKAFDIAGKPRNLEIIYSIPRENYILTNKVFFAIIEKYPFVRRFFSVFTRDFAEAHNIRINCGKHCIECGICYDPENNATMINEVKK